MPNPFDKRPLSQRLDLTYIRGRTWPKRQYQLYSVVAAVVVFGYVAYAALRGDQRIYSSGDIALVHASFADDCAKCHEADPHRSGYWLSVRDDACLSCHAAEAHHPMRSVHGGMPRQVQDRLGPIAMSMRCVDCHLEHQGLDHDLNHVADSACVSCHQNLESYRQSPPASAVTTAAQAQAESKP